MKTQRIKDIKGIRRICGETKSLRGFYGGKHLFLYLVGNELHAEEYHGCTGKTWLPCNDITPVGHVSNPMTMKEIKDMIVKSLSEETC